MLTTLCQEALDAEDLLDIGLLEGSLGLEKVDKERDVLELEWIGAFGQLCGRCPLEQSGPSGAVVRAKAIVVHVGIGAVVWDEGSEHEQGAVALARRSWTP